MKKYLSHLQIAQKGLFEIIQQREDYQKKNPNDEAYKSRTSSLLLELNNINKLLKDKKETIDLIEDAHSKISHHKSIIDSLTKDVKEIEKAIKKEDVDKIKLISDRIKELSN